MIREKVYRSDSGSVHTNASEAVAADLCHWVEEHGRMVALNLELQPEIATLMVTHWSEIITILQQARDHPTVLFNHRQPVPELRGPIPARVIDDQRHEDEGRGQR
jgi:hypothetical protein